MQPWPRMNSRRRGGRGRHRRIAGRRFGHCHAYAAPWRLGHLQLANVGSQCPVLEQRHADSHDRGWGTAPAPRTDDRAEEHAAPGALAVGRGDPHAVASDRVRRQVPAAGGVEPSVRDRLAGLGTVPEGPGIVATGGAPPATRRAERNPWIPTRRSARPGGGGGGRRSHGSAVPPPRRGGSIFISEHHGFRPAAPDSTRGYSPAPLRGGRMLRGECHQPWDGRLREVCHCS
jgi:hypothetical protein